MGDQPVARPLITQNKRTQTAKCGVVLGDDPTGWLIVLAVTDG
jgi:hypothetical protein